MPAPAATHGAAPTLATRMVADNRATIAAVATANPPTSYTQQEILDAFSIEDPSVRSVFLGGGIERRHLVLPPVLPDGTRTVEGQGDLLAKHTREGLSMGAEAVRQCVAQTGRSLADVAYIGCITSTGFLAPGFSAHLIKELGLDPTTSRVDVVGMGCNAGLNGLNAVAAWSRANPSRLALMVCIETCSAAYVFDGTMRTAVVNSLFGDGAAAIALTSGISASGPAGGPDGAGAPAPRIVDFSSRIIVDAISAMRYDWDYEAGKFSFFLDPDIPYVVGAHAEETVDRLLGQYGVHRDDVVHWIIHPGGKKVIDSVMVNLQLTPHDVRHTLSVLRDFGNLSSASFLFSYQRLLVEGAIRPGDLGVLMTMGPGSTIETALLLW